MFKNLCLIGKICMTSFTNDPLQKIIKINTPNNRLFGTKNIQWGLNSENVRIMNGPKLQLANGSVLEWFGFFGRLLYSFILVLFSNGGF